ncbi:MAG TPA: cytochrome b/b6 domain-containing protein [Bacteroidales bacterium]|nr:cytochrome b/b6 domain-containing protein [Bacteroidales bacterium]
MEEQSTKTVVSGSLFLQKHSAVIRIWHWLTFLLISLSIITVILSTTILNPRKNAGAVKDQLKEQNITLDDRQAFFLAHHFDDQLWDLHKILGLGITLLLIIRMVSEILMPMEERIRTRISLALKLFRESPEKKAEARHYLVVKVTYSIFYLVIILLAVTGVMMAFGRELSVPSALHHSIKEFHGLLQWLVYAFVIFHAGGVILADLGKTRGLVSGMIHGN